MDVDHTLQHATTNAIPAKRIGVSKTLGLICVKSLEVVDLIRYWLIMVGIRQFLEVSGVGSGIRREVPLSRKGIRLWHDAR